ncbi:MAG: class I SAM-dependent methyltransferase [Xanthobacteraceae bacterium]
MAQRLGGLHSVLRFAWAYSAFQSVVARGDSRRVFTTRYIRPRPGDRVVEVGCGPNPMLEYLEDVDYIGLDLEARYIESARRRYGGRGKFICGRAEDAAERLGGEADIVLGMALLHHLDDTQAHTFLRAAAGILKPHGRLITIDPVRLPSQHPVARLLIALDRGQNIRAREQYVGLASRSFTEVDSCVHGDLLRVPYDHCMMVCSTRPSGMRMSNPLH